MSFPYGAIKSMKEIDELNARAQKGETIPFYIVFPRPPGNPRFYKRFLTPHWSHVDSNLRWWYYDPDNKHERNYSLNLLLENSKSEARAFTNYFHAFAFYHQCRSKITNVSA